MHDHLHRNSTTIKTICVHEKKSIIKQNIKMVFLFHPICSQKCQHVSDKRAEMCTKYDNTHYHGNRWHTWVPTESDKGMVNVNSGSCIQVSRRFDPTDVSTLFFSDVSTFFFMDRGYLCSLKNISKTTLSRKMYNIPF